MAIVVSTCDIGSLHDVTEIANVELSFGLLALAQRRYFGHCMCKQIFIVSPH